ncbi:MAG: tetratricopeptide repeat protein [Planctomycetia bacterium]|nr:tetratricopeptide repeat protein [Planctomycetia bacterium]
MSRFSFNSNFRLLVTVTVAVSLVAILTTLLPAQQSTRSTARTSSRQSDSGAASARSNADANSASGVTSRVAERYWKILLGNPRPGAALERVYADAAQRSNGVEQLIAHAQKLAETSTGQEKANALTVAALLQMRRNNLTDAEELLSQALEVEPNAPQARLALANILLTSGRLAQACQEYERALQTELTDEERLDALQRLGQTYAKLQLNDQAEKIWDDMTAQYADDPDVLQRVAEIQADAGQFRKAANVFDLIEALAEKKNDVQTYVDANVAAGDMLIRLGEQDAALERFQRALDKLAPTHWLFQSIRDRIEYLFLLRGDYDGMTLYYQRRLESVPNDLDAAARLAVAYGALGQYDQAHATIETALLRAEQNIELRRVDIELALAQNDYVQADKRYTELEKLNALSRIDLTAWGDVALKNDALGVQQRQERAIELWTSAIDEENLGGALLIAEKLAENNFNQQAEELLQKLARENPEDFEVVKSLAKFYFLHSRDAEAFATLDAFSQNVQNDPTLWSKRAEFLRSLNYKEEALDAIAHAVALAPENFGYLETQCDLKLDVDILDQLDELLDQLDKIASTDEERTRAFSKRLTYHDKLADQREFLDQLQERLAQDSLDPEARAYLYDRILAALLYYDDPNGATKTLLAALNEPIEHVALLKRTPEIIAKSQTPETSLELLQVAIEKDPTRKVEYLRGVAKLQLELGRVDDALQAVHNALQESAADPANYRSCAELLLEAQQYDEAIELLQTAAQLDPSDRASLLRLAALLDQIGRTEEALNHLWTIYNNLTRLEDKLSIVTALAEYYFKLDRFEELSERLRVNRTGEDARRENAYCLARAQMTVKDYQSARNTLENVAAFIGARAQDDAFLLHTLSNLAELQNDMDAAIRYQEKLCDLDESTAEMDRLLALYRRVDDKAKSREYLKTHILPREPLWKQLETVDVLLSIEDYQGAQELLDVIDAKFPRSWEVLARRVALRAWTNDAKLNDDIALFRNLHESPQAKSSKLVAFERALQTSGAVTISGDAWTLGSYKGCALDSLKSPEDFRALAQQTLLCVYRDKLQLTDRNVRSAYAALAKPQMPTPNFLSYGAASLFCDMLLARALYDQTPIQSHEDLSERLKESFVAPIAKALDSSDTNVAKMQYAALTYHTMWINVFGNDDQAFLSLAPQLQEDAALLVQSLADRDDAWRNEAFPNALARLANAEGQDAEELATFLLDTLQRSLDANHVADDSVLWSSAYPLARMLNERRLAAQAKIAQELIARAGAKDYHVLLTVNPNEEELTFEDFAQRIKDAQVSALRQIRNSADVTNAREAFGQAFAAQARLELRRAFRQGDQAELQRALKTIDVHELLASKLAFGRAVFGSFVAMNRRDLFEGVAQNKQTKAAFEELQTRLYQILELACQTELEMAPLFQEKDARTRVAPTYATNDVLNYLSRNGQVAFNLAIYLIDKTLYDQERPDTILTAGKLLEDIGGALFALDISDANQSLESNPFTRYRKFYQYVETELPQRLATLEPRYRLLNLELADALQAIDRGETPTDTVEDAQAKANTILSEGRRGERTPTLVALALLAKNQNQDDKALEYLLQIAPVSLTESNALELAILEAFPATQNDAIRARQSEATERLLGRRLTEPEATRLWAALRANNAQEQAEIIRARLQAFASDFAVVAQLLDTLIERADNSQPLDDADAAFAVRVFRVPSWTSRDPKALAELRAKALAALAYAGKLPQTQESLQRLVENAPGAYDLLMRLAQINIQMGQTDKAVEILTALASKLPNDASVIAEYADTLAMVGQAEQARDFLMRAYRRKPEDYFAGSGRPSFWTRQDDLLFLKDCPYDTVAANAYASLTYIVDALDSPQTHETAAQLLQDLWNNDSADPSARAALRQVAARVFARNPNAEFTEYLVQWLLESIEPNNEPNQPYPDFADPHTIVTWQNDSPETLATAALLALDPDKQRDFLLQIAQKVDDICDVYAQRKNDSPVRQSAALVLQFELLARLQEIDQAQKALQDDLQLDVFCADGFKYDALALCLAIERFLPENGKGFDRDILLNLLERAYHENDHPAYERYFFTRIYTYGMLSDNEETKTRYVQLTEKKLLELLRLLRNADLASDKRVGGSMETVDSINTYVQTFIPVMLEIGLNNEVRELINASECAALLQNKDDPDALPTWRELLQFLSDVANEVKADVPEA